MVVKTPSKEAIFPGAVKFITTNNKNLAVFLAVSLATYQVFTFSIFGTYFPLSLFPALACIAFVRMRTEDSKIFAISIVYGLTLFVSILWSPDMGSWANGVLYETLFFIALFVGRTFRDDNDLRYVLTAFIIIAVFNAALVVLFRLLPNIEHYYLTSNWISVFRNPERVVNYGLFQPNAFDVDKAGGIFDNANTGAAFNLLCLGVTISLVRRVNGRILAPIGAMFVLSIFMSGSKSAIILSVLVLVIIVSIYMFRSNRIVPFVILGLSAILLAFLMPLPELLSDPMTEKFTEETARTTGYRIWLLQVAKILFLQHPILGLGFGGWSREMAPYASFYGLDSSWPPHNSLVNAWAQAGLISAILLVAIFTLIVVRLIRGFNLSSYPTRAGGALYGLLGVAGMSLGDPFPLFGNANMAFPLGLLVAWGMRSAERGRGMRNPRNDRSKAGDRSTRPN